VLIFYLNGTIINTLGGTSIVSSNTSLLISSCTLNINNNLININCNNGWNVNFNLP
jgi:hypothetical protein